jgi:C4-dicarboxylate-specific signal transduction histidine kinase
LRFLYRQPIRRQLIAATVILLIPVAAAIAWSANQTRLEKQNEIREQATSIAAMAAAQLELYFSGIDAMASAVTRHSTIMTLERDQVDRFLSELIRNQPLVLNLVLALPDGRVLAAASTWPRELVDVPPVAHIGLIEVGRTKRPYVSDFVKSPITGKSIALLAYPVLDDRGQVVAAFGLAIDLVRLQTVFASIPLPTHSVVTVTDRENRVIARSRDGDKFVGQSSGAAHMDADAPTPSGLRTDIDGIERFTVDVEVRHGAWKLSAGIPRSLVVQRLEPLWTRNAAIIGGAFVALVSLGLIIAWQTTLHLNRLRDAAQRVAEGDLSPMHRIQTPNLEFATLQDTFITMASNLREARDALDRQMVLERKMNEDLQSLQRQVVRQERLTAVGLLVSGVAHEVNNPLQAILGTAELLERHPTMPRELGEEVTFVKTQAGRAREIIRNLSRFSSQQSGPPALVDLRDVIDEVVQLRRRDLEVAGVSLDIEAVSTRKTYANFTELEQVILNFVINAQQSLEEAGGSGRILIRLLDVGSNIRVEVLDNGPGVKPENEPKLFQPFFTTKPVGKGTGLGLSVSYGIIDSYGGTIGYTRNDWGGAMFFFELPAGEGNVSSGNRPAVLRRSEHH